MQLIDQRLVPRDLEQPVIAPAERGIHHDALWHAFRAIAFVPGEVGIRVSNGITEAGIAPANVTGDGFGVGIEQKLGRVKAVADLGLIGTMNPVPVPLPGADLRQIDMPNLVRLLPQRDLRHLLLAILPLEETQFDCGRML